MNRVQVKHVDVTGVDMVAENSALNEELYRQIAAFAEKAWREVAVTQSFYDDYIRADLEQIEHD